MINKIYVLICDECGGEVARYETSAAEKAIRKEKASTERNTRITKRLNGAYHIKCELCAAEEDAKSIVKKYGGALKRLEDK